MHLLQHCTPVSHRTGQAALARFYGEPLPISEAWGHIADESDPSSKLEEGIEQTNLRKLPLCQVIVRNPLGQLWLVGKDILQGSRNSR